MIVDLTTFRLDKRPAFIVFEGINGCGKTTLSRNISVALQRRNQPNYETREPGGTPLGAELRKILLEWKGEKISHRAELLLFAADRAEHLATIIRPNLAKGITVLCDRYIYSTIAFQGYGRGISLYTIQNINALTIEDTHPDLVILIDLDPRVALARAAHRAANHSQSGTDSFEAEAIAFHERIRRGFLSIASESDVPFLILDGTHTSEVLTEQVTTIFRGRHTEQPS